MKTLFSPTDTAELLQRIDTLKPTTQRQWGKMDVAQMMAHCVNALEMGTGDKKLPRQLVGKLIGGFLKSIYSNDKPFGTGNPTDPHIKVTGACDFETEKQRLKLMVNKFHNGGAEKCTTHPHSFFGKLTPAEWGTGMYKHTDHHLTQFGV